MLSRNGRDILNQKRLQRIVRIALQISLAVVISFFVLKEIDLNETSKILSRMSIKAILIGFGCYCLLVLAKTLRFRTLLGLDSNVHSIFPILALHTFWGNFLPMRTGDISYIYLMQRRQKVDATQGIATLMVASIIDLVLLTVLMAATAILLLPELGGSHSWTVLYLTLLVIGTGLTMLMVLACVAPNFFVSLAQNWAKPLLRLEKKPITWFVNKCLVIVEEITAFRLNLRFLKVWGYSLLCLIIRFGFQCYLVVEMGVDIPLIEVLFALAFTNGFNLLPIQNFGNFGTTEFPFRELLHRLGTSKKDGFDTGFSLHLLILLYCIPLGIYGFFRKPKEE
ncbi:flippase-like domain-containing protein [Candidatus Poribacteria bacterium]|nr:flippase-like domain-containing protein [Candidatus Poribacteria bacterium]